MDIINTQKQKARAAQEAEQRHWERVRAGEEVLGMRTTARRTTHAVGAARHAHPVRRTLMALGATVLVFGLGCALYVGIKAYSATRAMTIVPTYTRAVSHSSQELATPPVAQTTHTKTSSTQNVAPSQQSFVRETLSAATSLVGKRTPLRGEQDGYINILLLGKGSKGHPGENLTDTIMLARIDVTRGKIALLSLPRDLYVRIPGTQSATKINALYDYGIRHNRGATPIVTAVQDITDLPVHYFLVADFDAFIAIVDALGGINVTVERPIKDTSYPGPNYSYETFTLAAGLQHLDGATALKYVRSRHGDPEGDFGRAKRQQQVLQALKNKAFSLGTLSNPLRLGEMLDALGTHVRTNMTMADMTSLVRLLPQLDTQNITTVVVDAWKPTSLLRVIHVGAMFALVPRAGRFDYTEIRTVAHTIFERPALTRLRTEIAREKPHIVIVRAGASARTAARVRTLIAESLALPRTAIGIAPTRMPAQKDHAHIVDHTNTAKPFTLTGLLTTLGATLVERTDVPDDADADVHVILGTRAETFFRASTVTKEQFEAADRTAGNRVMIRTEE